jgi:hypothetical protein
MAGSRKVSELAVVTAGARRAAAADAFAEIHPGGF